MLTTAGPAALVLYVASGTYYAGIMRAAIMSLGLVITSLATQLAGWDLPPGTVPTYWVWC